MRMSSWSPQIIRFMEDATAFTSYFADLAHMVRRHPRASGSICDAGCGMGQLSLELAAHARTIDAIDRSMQAIAHLGRKVESARIGNVKPILADVASHHPNAPYDLMVFCLSASLESALAIARKRRAGGLIVINKIHRKMEADRPQDRRARNVGERPIVYDFERSVAEARACGIACDATQIVLEFGQPFRTLEDAALYFGMFRTRSYPEGISSSELEGMLERTGDPVFPYYLSIRRHLALFSIDIAASKPARERELVCTA